jgi:RimJ/RimL family protein N-acetyltransferase
MTEADLDLVWRWRNDPETRQASFCTDEVPLSDHDQWFRRAIAGSDTHLLMLEFEGVPAGVVRFDHEQSARWKVSINLAPEVRGRRLATPCLELALTWLTAAVGDVDVFARVRPTNRASLTAFGRAGFRPRATTANAVILTRRAISGEGPR